MQAFIAFFLKNTHLNHLLLLFFLFAGVYAYINIPKEMFPDMELNQISITGAYAGTSATTLDKMVVRDIEEDVSSINGVGKTESIIMPGSFSITLSIDEDVQARNVLDKVEDVIAKATKYLPADMNRPIANMNEKSRDLVKLSIASDTLDFERLLEDARDIRREILKITHINGVIIFGGTDKKIEIKIDPKALEAYGLDPSDVIGTIKELSYTFPIGEIKDKDEFVFISTVNGKVGVDEWGKTLLHIGRHYLYLEDIATIRIYHPEDYIIASFDGERSLILSITKDLSGDSFKLSQQLHELVAAYGEKSQELELKLFHDNSVPVKNRLDVIIANLTLGLILIFFTMYFLINRQTALVVTMGVPFSFIIGLIFIYYMGYSLNLVSLIGAILVVGIVVDDAVVVSENIQRHIDEGMLPSDAALAGVKEVMLPVTLATLTTIVAFFPMFMLSGEMGLFIKLIPVVVILVLLGSLLESFLFLPLHAKTFLRKGIVSRDWSWMTDHYERLLHLMLRFKKRTLVLFFLFVSLSMFGLLHFQNFQFFPIFDADKIYITGKLNVNTSLERTYAITEEINSEILDEKEQLGIESILQGSGYRLSLAQEWVYSENMFFITINLYEMVDTNFVNRFINPILDFSFEFDDPIKKRTVYSYQIAERLREILDKYRERYDFVELAVMERRVGMINTDIEIDLRGETVEGIERSIKRLKTSLANIKDVHTIVDNVQYGKSEYKLKINHYGEQLGLTEARIASVLSGYFLGNRKAVSFDEDGVVEITTEFDDKDHLARLIDFELPLDNGQFIRLEEVVDLIKTRDYERIFKENGNIVKSVNAEIDKDKTTATEVLKALEPTIEKIRMDGIAVDILGEKEKSDQLRHDMIRAVGMALLLMLILLLLLFPKIKYALMILSVIPFSIIGSLFGHLVMDMNITMPSVIGMLGLAGVVINDGIIMLDFLHGTHDTTAFYKRAKQRLRPIIITSITTFIGLSTLIFFATGQARIMQPLAISLGFGLLWGTIVNLLYLPTLYAMVNKITPETKSANGSGALTERRRGD